MSNSPFTEPSLPLATRRQLPQHPKMRLSYILNPSEPATAKTTVVAEPVTPAPTTIPFKTASGSCSASPSLSEFQSIPTSLIPDFLSDLLRYSLSHNPTSSSYRSNNYELPSATRSGSHSSDFEDWIPSSFIPDFSADLFPYSLSYNPPPPHHGSSSRHLSSDNLVSSRRSSLLSSEFEDLIPSIPSPIHGLPFDLLPYSLSYNSNEHLEDYHDSSDAFHSRSPMTQGWNESTNLNDRSPVHHSPSPKLEESPVSSPNCSSAHTVAQSPPDSPLRNTLPLPRFVVHSVVHSPSPTPSRSPSPPPFLSQLQRTLPSLFISDFSFDLMPHSSTYQSAGPHPDLRPNLLGGSPTGMWPRCPILSGDTHLPIRMIRHASPPTSSVSSHTPDDTIPSSGPHPHDQSPLASPLTTPPSSPAPVLHPTPDVPDVIESPQFLPWEAPPPPGLDPQNHRAYQRAGVHWMLVSPIIAITLLMYTDYVQKAQIFGSEIG